MTHETDILSAVEKRLEAFGVALGSHDVSLDRGTCHGLVRTVLKSAGDLGARVHFNEEWIFVGQAGRDGPGLNVGGSSQLWNSARALEGLLGFCVALELQRASTHLPFPLNAFWKIRSSPRSEAAPLPEGAMATGCDWIILQPDESGILVEEEAPLSFPEIIPGMSRADVCFRGTPAPWTPGAAHWIRDAGCAAAEFVYEVERLRMDGFQAHAVVMEAEPGTPAANSGLSVCGVMAAGLDQESISAGLARLEVLAANAALRRKLGRIQWQGLGRTDPVVCSENLRSFLESAARAERLEFEVPEGFGAALAHVTESPRQMQVTVRQSNGAIGGVARGDLERLIRLFRRALGLYAIDYNLRAANPIPRRYPPLGD